MHQVVLIRFNDAFVFLGWDRDRLRVRHDKFVRFIAGDSVHVDHVALVAS